MTNIKALQAFPSTEYLRRLGAVKSKMARRDVDALVVTSPANITYLTGNLTRLYQLHALIVSIREEEPTFIVRQMDVPGCCYQTFMTAGKVIGYSEALIGRVDKDGFDAIIDYVRDLGLSNGSIGLEPSYLSGQTIDKCKARLPNARMVDCNKLVDWIRIVKSDLEVAALRDAAAIADAAILRAADVIRPGVREADAVAEIVATQVRGGPTTKPATAVRPPLLSSSPRTGMIHILWSEDVFRDGSQINIELSGIRYGYTAAIMRTFSIGKPSDQLRRIHDAEVAGLEAALATVRPGRTCSDVAKAFYRTIERHGFTKVSRCGYSLGIEWLEPTASLAEDDMTELQAGMTFHLMLGNWVNEEFGYVISESFCVTDSGVEVLTHAPRTLFQL